MTEALAALAVHSRTHEWADPMETLALLAGLTGREVMERMAAGELPVPPIASTLGFGDIEVGDDHVAIYAPARSFHYNPLGAVHGGVISALLDTASACAVMLTLDKGQIHTSLDLTTKFIRPMTIESGLTRCEGRVLHRGRRTAVAEAHLTDSAGRLLSHATSTLLITDAPS
jgi:uncharacterized protein (TIGR00369 family)